MPPKRKAPAAKAVEVDSEPEVVEANGSEVADPPKAKRGKAPKKADKSEDGEEVQKTTRTTRAKAAPEKVVVEPEPQPKKAKTKAAEKTSAEKKETKPAKDTKAKKEKAAAKPKSDVKAKTTKAKKGNDEPVEQDADTEPLPTVEPKPKKARKETITTTTTDAKPETLRNQTETDYTAIDFTCTKENANGKVPNFKISSWNVDGMRAWIKKNGLEYLVHEAPEILCLQETKCSKDKIPDEIVKYLDYKSYWCSSEKEGYAGVGLLTKVEPLSVEYGIGNEDFDKEGRCMTAEFEQFYIVNVYVPNAGRGLITLAKRLEWNTLFNEYVAKLDQQKPVIVCGDLNVAHNEIDLTNPKTNKKNAGFTQEERDGFTEFLSDQYVDTYRNLYPDVANAYTFWSYMKQARSKDVGWRLDYFVVSKRFMDNVCDNVIRTKVFGSDHCPITLFLNI